MTYTQSHHRLIRALQRGGVAISQDHDWLVCRRNDCRATRIGMLPGNVVDDLISAGSLVRLGQSTSRLIWVDGMTTTRAHAPIPACLPSNAQRNPSRRRELLEQAVYLHDCEIERRRLTKAVSRFNGDTEQATTPVTVTMRWDATHVDQGNSGYSFVGPGELAAIAASNLRQIRKFVGEDTFSILELILVTEVSRAGLARRLDIAPRAALKCAGEALVCLADAYDTVVPAAA